jgi:molybdopterin synthase sulfur carrier subunit
MRVNFYADLRPLAGGKTVTVDLNTPMTARQALESITHTRPALAEKIWQSTGVLFEHIHVFINGRQSVFLPQGMETPLEPATDLDVFPPVGGGSLA